MKYKFGNLRVDGDARTLSRADQPVHLTRKAFDLLLLLLECRPNAVSKDTIHSRLWPDSFVTESSLQTLIHELREAIDAPGAESWIRTIHGIGYSFPGDALLDDAPPPSPARPQRAAAWLIGESARVALHSGENIVGREPDGGVQIDVPTISRRHARITIGESIVVEDLGSKNGTWIQNERLTGPRTLMDGTVVRFGSAVFTVRLARPHSTESAELRPDDLHRR